MRPAYASIYTCLNERKIKLQLSIKSISTYSSAIFVLIWDGKEVARHYDVIQRHRFQKASYRTVHTETICMRFQMFPPFLEGNA